jgi:transcriptional regulator with XRE-family HTH domain
LEGDPTGTQKIGLHPVARDALRTLGQEVRIARTAKRWTAAKLAEVAGVSAATVSKIENGKPAVAVGNVLNVAAVAGIRLFSYADPSDIALRSRRGEDLIGLLPRRINSRQPQSEDDLDF